MALFDENIKKLMKESPLAMFTYQDAGQLMPPYYYQQEQANTSVVKFNLHLFLWANTKLIKFFPTQRGLKGLEQAILKNHQDTKEKSQGPTND